MLEKLNPSKMLPGNLPEKPTRPNGAATCSLSVAAERTRLLLGCFRKGEAEDPEVYVTAVAAMLTSYPEEVARAVTDPVRGIASEVKWLPTLAEVRNACARRMEPIYAAERRTAVHRENLRLRDQSSPANEEERERAVRHWHETVRPALVCEAREKSSGSLSVPELKAMISPEEWDAIPDAPERV